MDRATAKVKGDGRSGWCEEINWEFLGGSTLLVAYAPLRLEVPVTCSAMDMHDAVQGGSRGQVAAQQGPVRARGGELVGWGGRWHHATVARVEFVRPPSFVGMTKLVDGDEDGGTGWARGLARGSKSL